MNEVVNFLKKNNYQDVKFNEPLSKHTTFKVGGIASIIVEPSNKDEMIKLISFLNGKNLKYKIFGKGSNILPSDNFYDGVIIKTNKALNYLEVNNDIVTVGAGYSLITLANKMVNYELAGCEFLGGIPGTVGGAIYMNAGAYKREMKDIVINVTILNEKGEVLVLSNEDMQFGYRKSIIQNMQKMLILETKLKLDKGEKAEILKVLNNRRERRLNSQPLEYPCAGSTFRNPIDTHAYILIDEAGLRGYKIGGAQVSTKHCNFIINCNNAKAMDIRNLVDYIIDVVYKNSGIKLIPEIEFFNW